MNLPEDHTHPVSASLTEIPTSWTIISNAHTPGPARDHAMADLIGRYHDAIGRYLRIKLRDKNLADEVTQEFWIKLLNGKLAGADPNKGRFRDYLRTVIHRLIIDHFRARKLQPLPPGELVDPTAPDEDYDLVWRETVMHRVWSRLDAYEASTPKNKYAAVLHLRRDHPDESIDELAARLGAAMGATVSPEAFRKTLQRSRAKFIELLKQELRETIHPAEPEDIEAEIIDLGLYNLVRRYSSDRDL